ncbi:MAG: ABC transporter ATP-binding protein [Flammeovirgaceae bacterium]
MLEAKGIFKKYGNLAVLQDVSLKVNQGEVVSIVGASGAGKSTLLHILGTLDSPDQGRVFIEGTEVSALSRNKLAAFRNEKIGFVFQFHNLLPEFTAFENVCMPGLISGIDTTMVHQKADELFHLLNLSKRKTHKPSEMSGGEQQRTAVARALVNSPSIIFADEPSGNLDSKNANELHRLFFKLREELSYTFVIVTHNEEFAEMADRKLTMLDGQII